MVWNVLRDDVPFARVVSIGTLVVVAACSGARLSETPGGEDGHAVKGGLHSKWKSMRIDKDTVLLTVAMVLHCGVRVDAT